MPPINRPLQGLRVIDLCHGRGDLCGRLLGDLGADVLLVEPPTGSTSRRLPPFGTDGSSLYFAYRNTNKRSAILDLSDQVDRDRLLSLAAHADVVVESSPPGHLASLGIGAENLAATNSDLVIASLTDFGQTGPYRDMESTDDVILGLSGWLALSGIPEKPPLLPPCTLASDTLGILGVHAILVALVQRSRGGGGQHLDVSALEAVAQMNTWGVPLASHRRHLGAGMSTLRQGDSLMYPTVPCADGAVRQVVLTPGQWRAMWEWMDQPEEFAGEYWESFANRLAHLRQINEAFAKHWSDRTMVEGCREAQRRGIVATPMLNPADILIDEHFASRGTFWDVDVSSTTRAPVVSGLWEFDGERVGYRFRSPDPGEHTLGFQEPPFELSALVDGSGSLPLEGLRVADFGHGGVGVECGRMLADFGADVVKVESRSYPDFLRIFMGGEVTPSFASCSRNKRCLGLDLKHPDAREVVERLVAWADVLIENNSTGTMDRLGIGWQDVRRLNPKAVLVSSQLMGSRGIQAAWTGYGPTIQTAGGLSWLWAFDDGDGPPGNNAVHPDHLAGRLCAIGALATLIGMRRGSLPAHVEVAQVESMVATLGDVLLAEALEPGAARPEGNDSPIGAPWGVFPCAGEDRWCVVCVRHDDDWAALREAMDCPEWAASPDLATTDGRLAQRERVNSGLASWTRTLGSSEVQDRCQAVGVPAGRVTNPFDQLEDHHLMERGFLVEIDQTGLGPMVLEGTCIRGSAMPEPPCGPAPLIGEHSWSFCVQDLQMEPDRVTALLASGALEQVATDES